MLFSLAEQFKMSRIFRIFPCARIEMICVFRSRPSGLTLGPKQIRGDGGHTRRLCGLVGTEG